MFTTVKGRQVWIPEHERTSYAFVLLGRERYAAAVAALTPPPTGQPVAPFRCPHLAAQDKAHAGDASLITFRSGRFVSFGFLAFLFPAGWQDKAA